MANVVIDSTQEVRLYSDRVIAQVENEAFFAPLVGEVSDMNSVIYKPPEMFKNGRYWTVPLRKAVTTAALEDGATYEGQGQKSITSSTSIELNERGQVFGGFDTFESTKTILDLREMHYQAAAEWAVQDFDVKAFSKAVLATASLPLRSARSASQYNVEFVGDAVSWDGLNAEHKITAKSISRCKKYMQAKRGIRPARLGAGMPGFILILPTEATYSLAQEDTNFQQMLRDALPRSEDHVFFKGHGLNPWGMYDGVVIVEDTRPVYGGTDKTFLNTEADNDGGFIKFEGLFLGAQALAYAEWKRTTWFERKWDHDRKIEMSVSSMYGFEKPVINLGTLASATNRDYGLGYFCGTASQVDN